MNLQKHATSLASKLSFGALLGVLVFKGDACLCGGGHQPPPPPAPTSSAAAPTPPPPG